MFFTPFAFIQQPFAVPISTFTGFYIGGTFDSYANNNRPYFRMVDSTGSISSSFNIGAGFNNGVYTVTSQSDGKIIIGGGFTSYSGSTKNYIVRLNTNGTADTGSSWNQGVGFGNIVNTLAIQSDQKIVVGGAFTSYSGSGASRIARLNVSGTLDTGSTWNSGAGFNAVVNSIAIQPDQKIVAVGSFSTYSGSGANRIARLNVSGTLDTGSTWNSGAGFNSTAVQAVVRQPDGKLLVGGNFTTYSGSGATRIARVNVSGTLDPASSWNSGAGFNSIVYNIVVQQNQNIVVSGNFTTYSGSTANRLVRLNTSGTIDTSFNTGGGFDNSVFNIFLQSDQKILAQGTFANYSGSAALGIVRINNSGSRDTTFNPNLSINTANNLVSNSTRQLANGSIIVGGVFAGDKIGYATFVDTVGNRTTQSLVDSYGLNSGINSIVIQPDRKVILGGAFTMYSGSTKNYIVRLNTNGTADTGSSWNTGTGFNSTVRPIELQSDGKLIVGGDFSAYSGSSVARIARLSTSGTLDTTFVQGAGFQGGSPNTIAIQSDQKIIVGGAFTQYSGSTKNYIVRLNTNGTADTGSSWNQGVGLNDAPSALLVQPDQKIIVGGAFSTYSGSTKNYIVRLNTDGTADTGSSWNQGVGFSISVGNGVFAAALQSDGKIVAGGRFTTYSGSAVTRIARLNSNGTLDTTFVQGSGFGGNVSSITVEPITGKLLIGGEFTTYSGSTANRIVRLNTNGTIDSTFIPPSGGFNAQVTRIVPY
jgi:uncharacterized delta-60 repeat protein